MTILVIINKKFGQEKSFGLLWNATLLISRENAKGWIAVLIVFDQWTWASYQQGDNSTEEVLATSYNTGEIYWNRYTMW